MHRVQRSLSTFQRTMPGTELLGGDIIGPSHGVKDLEIVRCIEQ